jgi:hypothetical protein
MKDNGRKDSLMVLVKHILRTVVIMKVVLFKDTRKAMMAY